MKMIIKKYGHHVVGVAAAALTFVLIMGSCSVPKHTSMFETEEGTTMTVTRVPEVSQLKILPGDRLQILVSAQDASVAALFNKPTYSMSAASRIMDQGTTTVQEKYSPENDEGLASYMVDPKGNVEFPYIGSIHVAGMTRDGLQGYIKGELMGRDLVKNPTVTVEFLSAGINVLGEVKNPGRYSINLDQISVIDALSVAGGMKTTGRPDMVKVVRKEGNELRTYVLDLTDASKIGEQPIYYLQQDDVVYVEPNDKQKRDTKVNANNVLSTSFWISVASLLTTVVTTIGVFIK